MDTPPEHFFSALKKYYSRETNNLESAKEILEGKDDVFSKSLMALVLSKLPSDEELIEPVKIELQKEGIEIPSDEFMLRFISLMKERVTFMKDFISQGRYFFETPQAYDEAFKQSKWVPEAPVWMIEIAKQFETVENWQTSELESCLKHWVSKHELSLGKVLPAFRLAITGLGYGPVTFEVAQTIGKTETLLRLNKASEIK